MKEKDIYAKIRDLRRARGITVNKLAEEMGENHQKVGRIERGRRSLTVDYLMKVSKALDTPLETFFIEKQSEKQETSDTGILLNEIIVFVEENVTRFPSPLDAKTKGKLVSKVYELALKFPQTQQRLFLEAFFEGLFVLKSS